MESIGEILSREAIEGLRRPDLDEARGLPSSIYRDPEFFDLEQRKLFAGTWIGIAFDSDVPEPGDARPVSVLSLPLIIVRGRDRKVRVFHNVCRHRATAILDKPCSGLARFQCPYHAWTYDLDGSLLATPYWDGTAKSKNRPVDPRHNSLVEVRSEVWNRTLFVNIDGQAAPMERHVAPLADQIGAVAFDRLVPGPRVTMEFNANWKLVFENWEVYHHVWVHTGLFDRMSDEVDMETGEPYTEALAEGNVMVLRARENRPVKRVDRRKEGEGLPPLPLAEGASFEATVALAVLPNTTMTTRPVAFAPTIYTPLAADRTRAEMTWFFAPEAAEAERYKDVIDGEIRRWVGETRKMGTGDGIRPQDFRCMEHQQTARRSPVADDVKFSATWEPCVRYFQDWLVRHLE